VPHLDSEEQSEALLRRVRSADAEALLERLVGDAEPGTRAWALWAAMRLLGDRAVPLLVRALGDSDPDVRDDALAKLVQISPATAVDLLPKVRSKLKAEDDFEVASALWTLAELNDRESLPEIKSIESHPRVAWLAKPAYVASLLIQGKNGDVLNGMREHDHPRMRELAHGAALLGTPEAMDALSDCAEAPELDSECRALCRWFLKWRSDRSA
jgi:HEAT repeat protein